MPFSSSLDVTLPAVKAGEIPRPTDVHYSDPDGNPVDLTLATSVKAAYTVDNGTATAVPTVQIVAPATDGRVRFYWPPAATAAAGNVQVVVWANLPNIREVVANVSVRVVATPVTIT